MKRVLPIAGTVLAALFGVTACSPADRPLLAVGSAGGQPVILMAPCDRLVLDSVSVFSGDRETSIVEPQSGNDPPVAREHMHWHSKMSSGIKLPPAGLPLLNKPPTGWEVSDPIPVLRPNMLYTVSGYATIKAPSQSDIAGDHFGTTTVAFSAEALAGLAADEVLVASGHSDEIRTVTMKEFHERAQEDC